MERTSVDDYIQKGLYGEIQTKPDERRKFLGTLRERIVVAITKSQVMDKSIYDDLDEIMRSNKKAKVLLNGEMDYSYLSPYIKLANKHRISFSIVENKQSSTDIGLILAYDYAIDKDEIYLKQEPKEQTAAKEKKQSLFQKLFRKK
ncbi:YueI family protein [Falsibacillus pallidus]|uniref:YueI family protein n=1 Tax=Falsibacillus pallidus TaxID=493781 RepID=UPI003D9578C2